MHSFTQHLLPEWYGTIDDPVPVPLTIASAPSQVEIRTAYCVDHTAPTEITADEIPNKPHQAVQTAERMLPEHRQEALRPDDVDATTELSPHTIARYSSLGGSGRCLTI